MRCARLNGSCVDDELMELASELPGRYAQEVKHAYDHLLEWQMDAWIAHQSEHDVAPSTAAILMKREEKRRAIPPAFRPRSWGIVLSSTARNSASRWRKKWDIRFGKVYYQDRLTPEQIEEKASAVWQWANHLEHEVPTDKAPLWINMDETGYVEGY